MGAPTKRCAWIGADGLVYQDLQDLIDAVGKKGKTAVQRFDTSVFNGEYVTGDITPEYLNRLRQSRNDDAKVIAWRTGPGTSSVCTTTAEHIAHGG